MTEHMDRKKPTGLQVTQVTQAPMRWNVVVGFTSQGLTPFERPSCTAVLIRGVVRIAGLTGQQPPFGRGIPVPKVRGSARNFLDDERLAS